MPFSGDGNTIDGCYSNVGALKLLTPSQPRCTDGMTPIHWNATDRRPTNDRKATTAPSGQPDIRDPLARKDPRAPRATRRDARFVDVHRCRART